MLRSVDSLIGYDIQARDDRFGVVSDFYFDDAKWTIRYLVADSGKWIPGRKVLISPEALHTPEWVRRNFPVNLTSEQIKNGPSIAQDEPVSRQHEIDLHNQFGWPRYWTGGVGFGGEPTAKMPELETQDSRFAIPVTEKAEGDPHLRSCLEVREYKIHASDGHIGHVDDFLVDDDCWAIRYLVVDTRDWIPGRRVLVAVDWIKQISWEKKEVLVGLNRDKIKASPHYDPSKLVDREYEESLFNHYGQPRYWR